MEGLIQLVAESFARHGVECPGGTPQKGEPQIIELLRPVEGSLPAVLPEHNYRKKAEVDPAP
jgi:hypothetical protein